MFVTQSIKIMEHPNITMLFLFLTCLFPAQSQAQNMKVLVHMGLGTNSHIKPLLELGTILRERNHNVIYVAFDSAKKYNKPYKFPFISLGNSSDVIWDDRKSLKEQFMKRETLDPAKEVPKTFGKIMPKAYDATYPSLAAVLDEENPDVVLCDFFSAACRDVVSMKGIPLVTGFQTTDMSEIADAPFVTTTMKYGSVTTEDLNFIQRFQTKLVESALRHMRFVSVTKEMNKVRAKYGVPPTSAPFGDFSNSLGLASTFVGFEAALPFPPHIKMIGPIRSDFHDPLSPELVNFLESHPRTLYIAFGSAVILADFDVENIVVASLTALESKHIDGILWGLGQTLPDDFPDEFNINNTTITRNQLFSNEHPHVRLLPWAPQTAILEHKHTRLFISHGGLESSFEAILSGTPILCMPFLGDQPRNARKLEDAGVGKYVNRATTTPSSLSQDIQTMMDDVNGEISVNVQRMQTIATVGSRRKASGADAIEEYVATARVCRPISPHNYGETPCELKHLTSASRNMNFIAANLIDVYIAAILLALAALFAVGYISFWLISRFSHLVQKDLTKKNI
ncbi:hypothetical protein DSO57_1022973 [Entomophthora muscae]|uniref:Uncharacterized protein n=1 Tax=Entomophthora muscae TaxID=34485 RepID=A0ACC2TQK1_9FUNG|nr:hypothetical protein DSO57_1022973 [Entomophthora muscae]